ncbi:hypothetical protein AB833_30155 [Chromatiales bacterium (ex Bugula neritina AB1)]|nr:hypothetical protein AB833_30155 [Chromatiales bacterium (ex Bugula neritina AB1)]
MESRILGALIEKQLSTPDSYPLTVNSLLSACNQKSNREPVSTYEQGEVVRTLRQLEQRRFVRYEMGARSERYEQRLGHELSLSKKQQALLCVMMLRGPQTPNELMTRTQRLYEFTDREDMLVSLERMTQGAEPVAILIPRQSGQRDDRYGHLLCGKPEFIASANNTRRSNSASEIEELKNQLSALQKQLDRLYELTGHTPE